MFDHYPCNSVFPAYLFESLDDSVQYRIHQIRLRHLVPYFHNPVCIIIDVGVIYVLRGEVKAKVVVSAILETLLHH